MNNYSNFETLLKLHKDECKGSRHNKWYPHSIDSYRNTLKLDNSVDNAKTLKSNIAYSLQFLEFLELSFSELELSDVLYTMLVKTYVVTGMSILEGIFSNILKSRGWWKTTDLELIDIIKSNPKEIDEVKYVVHTYLHRTVDKHEEQMNLDDMIKKLEKHHDALSVDHLVYPALKRLRQLRNRIHLQSINYDNDHDYNAFDWKVKKEMGSILYQILTSNMISIDSSLFSFLENNYLDEETNT